MSRFSFNRRSSLFRRLTAAALLLFFIPALSSFGHAYADIDTGYSITNYTMEGTWHEDNSVTVTEHIDVNFAEYRHGIYRSLPLYMHLGGAAYGGEETISYLNRVEDVRVTSGDPFEKEADSGNLVIRIGSESETLIGDKSYDIAYTYVMPEDRIDTADFLYYSPLGADWSTNIAHFSFVMHFDKALPQEAVDNLKVMSGSYGNEENSLNVAVSAAETVITGEAFDIPPNQSITFFTTMPDGYFAVKSRLSPIPSYLTLGGFVAALLASLVLMFRNRSKKPVRTVQFYPPEGLCSAEVGVIQDEEVDNIDLISLIPYWAQNGHLTMEETGEGRKKRTILHKKKGLPSGAPKYQHILFNALFHKGDECNLKKLGTRFGDSFDDARSELYKEVSGERELSTGSGKAYLMVLLSVLFFGATIAINTRVAFGDDWIMGVLAAGVLLAIGVIRINKNGKMFLRKTRIWFIIETIFLGLMALAFAYTCTGGPQNYFLPKPVIYGMLAAQILLCAFCGRIMRNTDYKTEMQGKIQGLKEFIRVAEEPRLKMLLDENPSYFYDVLPYAMVFGMADKWAKRFDSLTVKAPDWYSNATTAGVLYGAFRATDFERSLTKSVITPALRSSATSSSTASSSGGGSFSGGGGGGGGGGSW